MTILGLLLLVPVDTDVITVSFLEFDVPTTVIGLKQVLTVVAS